MSSKRWRVLSLACMYIESAPPDHDPRMPFFGAIIHSHDYEVQHMDVKLTREKGVRVVATRLTEEEAEAMAQLLRAIETN